MKLKLSLLLILSLLLFSCSSKTKNDSENNDESNSLVNTYDGEVDNEDVPTEYIEDETNIETNTLSSSGCNLDDGTYSATVGYNNLETGYSATYTLDVDVEDCQVVQINFPNDGYLDLDHISATDIDEDGNANVDGENGKTYEIQIDN